MAITNAHLHWFKLKCPYPQGSKAFRMAKAKLDNATAADLERLRAEFELYKDGSIPVTHYSLYDEWFASVGSVKTEQVNMKGIQRVPESGHVQILFFTDRQYQLSQSYHGKRAKTPSQQKPSQLTLF